MREGVHVLAHALLLLGTLVASASGYRILGVFPHVGRSHFSMTGALMKGLAARGHDVVVISPFPQSRAVANYTDISLREVLGNFVSEVPLSRAADFGGVLLVRQVFLEMSVEICDKTFSNRQVQELLESDQGFDLVVLEAFALDCFLVFPHLLRSPFALVSTSAAMPWTDGWFGNPGNPSHVPVNLLGHADRMTFWERLVNTVFLLGAKLVHRLVLEPRMAAVVERHFGASVPPLGDIARNASVCLLNTHFSLNQPRPLLPSIVEVGGLHMQEPGVLPMDLQRFLDGAVEGAVYFSLGSTLRMDSMPERQLGVFTQAFSELPQRVLCKWESGALPNSSRNVRSAQWLPQIEILSHRNVKAFITHGGLMGSMEAAYFGVPMVAMPLFGDQHLNVRSFVEEGIAVKLDYSTISKDSLLAALRTVLDDPSYAENARRLSTALRDRPSPPLDTAAYWLEYAARHRGAPQLRSAARELAWHQYLLLDVSAFLLLGALLAVAATARLFRAACRRDKRRNSADKKLQ
ncbi:UDP-glycosyltransferase UGT5-like [Bacillus rossius redtenbacheri]|uniref:UDP-glycosyltransferase UGT5-like n=1 Tax=Bacillus rossius redtenbacheri TaxID=93214 RepID=UPI002FDEB188